MTGHLVFSTLHTNDCPSTIGRLVDIGIPSYMLASSVSMVLSQRLVRRLCPQCKKEITHLSQNELETIGFSSDEIPDLTIYGAKGCPVCNGNRFFFTKEPLDEAGRDAISKEVGKDINTKLLELFGDENKNISDLSGKWINLKPKDI